MNRWQWVALGLAAIGIVALTLALGVMLGKGCAPGPITVGIDAGPGDRAIAAELDASLRREDERMRVLLAEHEREIAEMPRRDRAEFEQVRSQGRDELAIWLKERTLRLIGDGGR